MKKKYTKKQILEAIKHWQKELDEQYTSHDARIEDRIKDSDIRSQSDDDNIMRSFNEFLKQYDALSPEDKKTAVLTVLIPSMNEAQLTRCIGYIGVSPAVKKCMKQLLYAFQNYFDDYPGSFDERVYESKKNNKINDKCIDEYDDEENGTTIDDIKKSESWNYVTMGAKSKRYNQMESLKQFIKLLYTLKPFEQDSVLASILGNIDSSKIEKKLKNDINTSNAQKCIKQFLYAIKDYNEWHYSNDNEYVYESKKSKKLR